MYGFGPGHIFVPPLLSYHMYGFGPGHIFVPPLLSYHMYVFGPGHIFVSLRFLSGFQTTSGLLIWIQTK